MDAIGIPRTQLNAIRTLTRNIIMLIIAQIKVIVHIIIVEHTLGYVKTARLITTRTNPNTTIKVPGTKIGRQEGEREVKEEEALVKINHCHHHQDHHI